MRNYQDQIRETESGKLISPSEGAGTLNKKAGSGIPIPFPFVDFKKMWDVVSNPTLFKGPEVSEKEWRANVAEYKRQYNDYQRKGGTRSYGSWVKWKGYGRGLDIHKAIGKLRKPKGGWTLLGHKYTGPYNDLENQVRWDPKTGEILEIYDKPTGRTAAIAMQHDGLFNLQR